MNNLIQQAVQFHQAKNWPEAKRIYDYLLKVNPRDFDALLLSGLMEAENGNPELATQFLQRAVKVNNTSEAALYNLAAAYSNQQMYIESERFYKQTLLVNPKNIRAIQELAALNMKKGKFHQATEYYKKALELDSSNAKILCDFGESQRQLGLTAGAVKAFETSLSIQPNNVEALVGLGNAYYQLGKWMDAKVALENALGLNPQLFGAYLTLADVLRNMGLLDKAMIVYDMALDCEPDSGVVYLNKGQLWATGEQFEYALREFTKANEIDSEIRNLPGAIINAQLHLCEWSVFDDYIFEIKRKINEGKQATEPFITHAVFNSLEVQKKASEIFFNSQFGMVLQQKKLQGRSPIPRKIVVAYLSADFRSHPISFLMAELFEVHDRKNFEIIGISFSSVKDEMQQRLSSAFDHYVQAHAMSDQEVSDLISSMGVDIAIDLGGYTQNSRFKLFARRVAPIQISYLGYLGTTGSNCIDYIIADKEIIPTESQKYYTEKIAYLPSYQVNDSKREISERIFTREELGIPKDAFVFCCFNNNFKILPEVFTSWMRILQNVTNSVLFLFVKNQVAQENLKKEALKRGINPDRLIFGGKLQLSEYLARYRAADLFLDTFPYNAGTTASDSLWAGVPVLTRQGETFSSRVASSLLQAIGLSELITKTVDEYEELACALAKSPNRLAEIKNKLHINRQHMPLFDTKAFARSLERLYILAYERLNLGLNADHIYVDSVITSEIT